MREVRRDISAIREALLGGTFDHTTGLVHTVRQHEVLLRGEDGKGGLVQACEDVKVVKVVSRAAWIAGGIVIAVFGTHIGNWLVEHAFPKR